MQTIEQFNLGLTELKPEDAASINGGLNPYYYMKAFRNGNRLKVKSLIPLDGLGRKLFRGRDRNGDNVLDSFRYFPKRISRFASKLRTSYDEVLKAIDVHIAGAGFSK